jgi:hypothetical protein
MSTENILPPVPTGGWINFNFYPGCRYAAFPARSSAEVKIYI